ncbi:acyltransferase [Paenibacillus xerothermodurans]|uniref:Acyltransferase n=1 Tax=Paenibacillus xerothermodurans TaxID=1977292 RepID=A0A2W1NVJ1_PAEXE|nr:acyltransferase [Paenibacillus xerothermodurans]PZE22603.1 acyltransferase [Paenibacillus xerothermodurans]
MAKKARIEEIQYLRGLAFAAVVLQHAIGHYAYLPEARLEDGVLLAVFLIAAKFAVPVFIFITGLVLFYNYRDTVPYKTFLWKRCKDIVLPYLVWSLVYALIAVQSNATLWSETKEIVKYWVTGTASYHLWYVAMVIQLYLLFPWIQRLVLYIRRTLTPRQLTAVFMLFAVCYVLLTQQVGTIADAAAKLDVPVLTPLFTEYADRNAFYFYIYFIMGAAAGSYVQEWRERIMNWRGLWISLYAAFGCCLLYTVIMSFRTDTGLHIQFNRTLLLQPFMAVFLMLSVIGMSIAAIAIHRNAGARFKRWLTLLGHYSYGAYLAHALILDVATDITDIALAGWNVSYRTITAFAICALLSVVLTVLLGRVPIGRLLAAAPAPLKRAV